MPQGSFNISRLIAELGLKNVKSMDVREQILPVLPMATMAGQVPVHVGSCAMFGGFNGAIVGEHSVFEIRCLDPGGGIIQWIRSHPISLLSAIDVSPAPIPFDTGPVALTPVHFTNTPTPSTALMGSKLGAPSAILPRLILELGSSTFAPLYVPRGSNLQIVAENNNAAFWLSFIWCGITATEGGE